MMKQLVIAIQAALGTSVLLGCATPGVPVSSNAPMGEVKPVLAVRGAAEARDYYMLGRHFHAQGRLTQAVEAYRKALALDNRNVDAHNGLGTLLASIGDLGRAVGEFNAAIAIDPRSAQAHNNLGYALHLQQRDAEAVAAFRKAVALDSSNAGSWINLGRSLAQLGDQAGADDAFARASDPGAAPTAVAVASTPPSQSTLARSEIVAKPAARAAEGPILIAPSLLVPIALVAGPDSVGKALVDAAPLKDDQPAAVVTLPLAEARAVFPGLIVSKPDPVATALLAPQSAMPAAPASLEVIDAKSEPTAMPATAQALALTETVVALSALQVAAAVAVGMPAAASKLELIDAAPMPSDLSPIAAIPAAEEAARTLAAAPRWLVERAERAPEAVVPERVAAAPPTSRLATGTLRQVVVTPEPVAAALVESTMTPAVAAVAIIESPPSAVEPSPTIVALAPAPGPAPVLQPDEPAPMGTIVTEVPTGVEAVAVSSAVVELRWTGTTVLARPMTMAEVTAVPAYRIEIANGNGITGHARLVSGLFAAIGEPRARLTNQKPFAQRTTVVQYRDGHREQALALAARMPNRPGIAQSTSLRRNVDVRIVLGYDVPRDVALLPPPDMQAARRESSQTPSK